MTETTRIWDRLPQETDKAFAAWLIYRQLPPYGENSRSIDRVKKVLGLSSGRNVNEWSVQNHWVERVRAWDEWQASRSITLVEAAQADYAKVIVTATTARLTYLGKIVEKLMKKIDEQLDKDEYVDPADIKRVVEMVKTVDDLGRRAAGLPTNYLTKPAETDVSNDQVYIIGAERELNALPDPSEDEDYEVDDGS